MESKTFVFCVAHLDLLKASVYCLSPFGRRFLYFFQASDMQIQVFKKPFERARVYGNLLRLESYNVQEFLVGKLPKSSTWKTAVAVHFHQLETPKTSNPVA